MIHNREHFCARLKKGRKDAGLKQSQVARYLQIPVSAVSALESGQRKVDALELYMLSKLYNQPIDWFFESGTSHNTPHNGNGNGHQRLNSHNGYGHPMVNHTREQWDDPLIAECLALLKKAPSDLQRSAAYGMIGFLKQN